jgi:pyruvate-ferredoxin/flavodoxin oxidoreductase
MKIEALDDADIRAMIDDDLVRAHRWRGLSPDRPVMRGTAQNPDVFFQARETANPFYLAVPGMVQKAMDKFAGLTGRQYHLFDYAGAADAERVIVLMGSGAEAVQELVEHLVAQGERVGVVKVRLFRPFSVEHFIAALPPTVKTIAALDRTKEPGSTGEPLYQDVVAALAETIAAGNAPFDAMPHVVGGRYGLSSKEFTPAMVEGIFDEMAKDKPKNHFTIGIIDDVTHTSLDYDPAFSIESPEVVRALFYGLGSDGTVGANKNSIKIIGEETPHYAQGYFVIDSKKSGSTTVSHLRFGPRPIHSTYLIDKASFIACHHWAFLEQFDILKNAMDGATFLINSVYAPDEVWDHLPRIAQKRIIDKKLHMYVIDGYAVAAEMNLGRRINTVMQTCFFALSGVLPKDEAIEQIKKAIQKTYGKRGRVVVEQNFAAVDAALAHLHEVKIPEAVTSLIETRRAVPQEAPAFVQNVTAEIIAGRGDALPVSALPIDGTYPTGTARWEKRNIALEIPVWDEEICIQCGKCVMVCPHSTIRAKIFEPSELASAPEAFKSAPARWKEYKDLRYTLQVAPEDCTGCTLCVEVCPVKHKQETRLKAINMQPQLPLRESEAENWKFFLDLPEFDRNALRKTMVKDAQLLQPLFEFSGACSGCGETPYLRVLTQLFGDHVVIANATGCSSIYGGNLPTTPWAQNREGRGPAWSNSLFEDNAEFGLGFRLTLDKQIEYAHELIQRMRSVLGDVLVDALLNADQSEEEGLAAQRKRVEELKMKIGKLDSREAKDLLSLADVLVKKDVWIVGGDGWAYDIGYGGLDHVLASGRNVKVLVLDSEVYSNTGGQMSKATPRAAVAKFAAGGKPLPKKDLARLAMTYGNVYVAQIAMGANDAQTLKAFVEAESYDGPALIIAYSHCIAHGIDMAKGLEQQDLAVKSAYWPLFRFDPRLAEQGKNPLQLDSKAPAIPLEKYIYNETRYKMLTQSKPEIANRLLAQAQADVNRRWKTYEQLAALNGKLEG